MGLFDEARAALADGSQTDLRIEQALEIARAYGETLEDSRRVRGAIADIGELPYPKDTIKWALLVLLAAITDSGGREPLKVGYVALAEWQVHADFEAGAFDSTRLRKKIDPLALAKEFAARRTPADRRAEAAREEQATLIAELRRKGFW